MENNIGYYGFKLGSVAGVNDGKECRTHCMAVNGCLYWTLQPATKVCYLKSSDQDKRQEVGKVSGGIC